jgi:hypothetical protein
MKEEEVDDAFVDRLPKVAPVVPRSSRPYVDPLFSQINHVLEQLEHEENRQKLTDLKVSKKAINEPTVLTNLIELPPFESPKLQSKMKGTRIQDPAMSIVSFTFYLKPSLCPFLALPR